MPDALEGVYLAAPGAFMPAHIGSTAAVTDPFRPELKCLAGAAALHHEAVLLRAFPKRCI
jgi:hypothetical protein